MSNFKRNGVRIMTTQTEKELMNAGETQHMPSGNVHGIVSGEQEEMKGRTQSEDGKVGWILLWAMGIPIPILLVLFVLRGCT
jgi:hypothetical protein